MNLHSRNLAVRGCTQNRSTGDGCWRRGRSGLCITLRALQKAAGAAGRARSRRHKEPKALQTALPNELERLSPCGKRLARFLGEEPASLFLFGGWRELPTAAPALPAAPGRVRTPLPTSHTASPSPKHHPPPHLRAAIPLDLLKRDEQAGPLVSFSAGKGYGAG